jgi:C-terminal processing protease CtpA/Prc
MRRPAALVFGLALAVWPTKTIQAQEAAPATNPVAPSAAPAPPSTTTPATPNAAPAVTKSPTAVAVPVQGTISKADRERALGMLDAVMKGIQENYYDPKLKGLDWDSIHEIAKAKIEESNSLNGALAQIAAAVGTLNDGHTRFVPPYKPYKLDFGLEYQMVWSRCFVTRVRPGSDAAVKNVRPGAEVLHIDGIAPSRQNVFDIDYLVRTLDPREDMALELQYPSGEKQSVVVKAKVSQQSALTARFGGGVWNDMRRRNENEWHRLRIQVQQYGDVSIVRFPEFIYDASDLYELHKKIRNSSTTIIDLRGNPGGAVDTFKLFAGMFFDTHIKVDDTVGRKKTVAEMVKPQHHMSYSGKVIVLIDSKSASAAEMFARVMQLEKRGTVIGDLSSGYVMENTWFPFFSSGVDYGAAITIANLIMKDGKSIEHHGVKPDDVQFPQPTDIEAGRDPVLAHAAEVAGAKLTPEEAGKLFPYEWPPYD